MATKKREIYGRMAVQLRTHDRCRIAEEICPGAMGLYTFLVLQARGEQTHGETLDLAAYESWGAPTAYRKKQAAALIESGLVERKGRKLVVVKYLEHNDGPEDIATAKDRANARQDKKRHGEKPTTVTRDNPVTATGFPCSISSSLSGSDLDLRSGEPSSTPGATPEVANSNATPPTWWLDACATVTANVCPVDQPAARWLEYAAARERKGWGTGHRDAVGWLSQVVRRELRDAPRSSRVGTGGGPRGDRQGLDGWTPPARTGTDDDPFGGGT